MKAKRIVIHGVVLLVIFSLGVGAGLLGSAIYATRGRAELASRLATLSNLRRCLFQYAEANGRYPSRLEDAVEPKSLLTWLEADRILYMVTGREYPLVVRTPLFIEKTPRRYGFVEGRFEFYEHDWSFRLDYSGSSLEFRE